MKKDIKKTKSYKKFRQIILDEERIAQSQKKCVKFSNPYIELKKCFKQNRKSDEKNM